MAALAVLLGSLLPTLSAARPTEPDWSQICTVHGALGANVGQTPTDHHLPAPGGEPLFEHCPYCALHVALLVASSLALVGPTRVITFTQRGAYIAAAPTLRLWSDALSRAPPVA